MDPLTHKIIGCAYTVYNTLGSGFLESVYRKALSIEIETAGLTAESEKPLQVTYKGRSVGDFYVDLLVENDLIIELKSVERLAKIHEVQLVNYLNGLNKEIGLLINFGPTTVEVKRKYRRQVRRD